jgi:predicted RNA-binding protein with EMAP domain
MSEELMSLKAEIKALSMHIASLKRRAEQINDGLEKEKLTRRIITRQWQVLFYLEKIENLSRQQSQTEAAL